MKRALEQYPYEVRVEIPVQNKEYLMMLFNALKVDEDLRVENGYKVFEVDEQRCLLIVQVYAVDIRILRTITSSLFTYLEYSTRCLFAFSELLPT